MKPINIDGVKQDSDINRLLKTITFKKTDHVPCFEHFVMKNIVKNLFGEERIKDIIYSEEMRDMMFLLTDTETRDNFKITNDMIWQVWEQDLMDWYSYMMPPENVVQLLKATGVDCASVPCGWEPMTHKFLGAKGTAISLGLKDRDLKKLKVPEMKVEKMLELVDWYIKACKGTGIGVGVNVRSCFTNTCEVLGMEKFLLNFYRDIEQIEHLFDIFTEYSLRITKGLSNRPINCFWIDDDLCTNQGFFVNPKFIKRYWIPRTETILEPIKKKGIPIFMHCCGNIEELLPIIIDMGFVGIHPIQPNCNDIYKLKEKFGNKITFFGNMDIAGVLAFGTPEEVIEDTKAHINKLALGGGYVVASSHSIIDRIPYENYIAMIKTAQSYTNY